MQESAFCAAFLAPLEFGDDRMLFVFPARQTPVYRCCTLALFNGLPLVPQVHFTSPD
jgi:hypothetical protein